MNATNVHFGKRMCNQTVYKNSSSVLRAHAYLVDLSVNKKILNLFFVKNNNNKNLMIIDFVKFLEYIPKEFSRKLRTFDDLPRFKATEFRQIVLYIYF